MRCCVKICGEFALASVVIVALIVVVHLQLSAIAKLHLAIFLAIIWGGLVILIALFGLSGVFRMSHCMLVVYAVVMLLAMLIKLTFALIIFAQLESVLKRIPEWLDHSFTDRESFHALESSLQCCGPRSHADYSIQLPHTCCASKPCNEDNAYQSCSVVLHSLLNTFGIPAAVIALVVGLIELIAVVVVLTLIHHSRKKEKKLRKFEKMPLELAAIEHEHTYHNHVSDAKKKMDHHK